MYIFSSCVEVHRSSQSRKEGPDHPPFFPFYGVISLSCGKRMAITVFPRLERARSINFRLAPRGVVFEGAL